MIIKGRSSSHFALFAVALLVACSGEDPVVEDDPKCTEVFAPDAPPNPGDARFVGTISVVDNVIISKDAAGVLGDARVGRITGAFLDYAGAGTSTPAMQIELGERCFGFVSQSSPSSPTPVMVDRLVVEGTGRGTVEVPQNAVGKHIAIGDPLNVGATEMTAKGTGTDFMSFETSITASEPLSVSEPVSDGTGEILRSGLRIRWNEGNGEAVAVVITPESQSPINSGGRIVCEVIDDGCFDIPAAATTFLLSSNVLTYNMIVSRIRADGMTVNPTTYVEMRSSSEWHADLDNGVFE